MLRRELPLRELCLRSPPLHCNIRSAHFDRPPTALGQCSRRYRTNAFSATNPTGNHCKKLLKFYLINWSTNLIRKNSRPSQTWRKVDFQQPWLQVFVDQNVKTEQFKATFGMDVHWKWEHLEQKITVWHSHLRHIAPTELCTESSDLMTMSSILTTNRPVSTPDLSNSRNKAPNVHLWPIKNKN